MNPRARDVVARLQRAGFIAYLAGGCVRDHLLGLEAKDCDVATSASPEEVQDLFSGRVTDLVGKSFGVVRVIEGGEFFEVAMYVLRSHRRASHRLRRRRG
jgi:poly(A) polymerase